MPLNILIASYMQIYREVEGKGPFGHVKEKYFRYNIIIITY